MSLPGRSQTRPFKPNPAKRRRVEGIGFFPGSAVLLGLFSQRAINSADQFIDPGQDDTTTKQQDTAPKIEWSEIVELPRLQNGVGHVIWIVSDRHGCAYRVTVKIVKRIALAKQNDIRGVGDVVHRVNVLDPTRRGIGVWPRAARNDNGPLRGGPVEAGPGVLKTRPAVVDRVHARAEEHQEAKPDECPPQRDAMALR